MVYVICMHVQAPVEEMVEILAVLAMCDVLEEDDDHLPEGNGDNDGHGGNDGCDALVQADEPVVKVDKPVASVDLHHQWKSHSLMVRAGNSMAWAERNIEWSPFSESMSSVQDLLEDFSSLNMACILTPTCFKTKLKLNLHSFNIFRHNIAFHY